MKKNIMLMVMLFLFCFAGTANAADITVKVDNKVLTQKGMIMDGEVMIPIKEVADELGFEASYESISIEGIDDISDEVKAKANENNEINFLDINDRSRKKPHQFVASMSGTTYSRLLPGADGSRSHHFRDYTSKVALQVQSNGEVMVPLNAAITMLDTQAKWEPEKNSVTFLAGVKPPNVYSNLAEVTVKVDGSALKQKGVILDGRTMVPIRDIGEALGMTVEYDDNVVNLKNGEIPVGMIVGELYTTVTLQPTGKGSLEAVSHHHESDVSMQNIGGKMMVPLKVISEMLDADISWDGTNYVASVTQKPKAAVTADGKIDLMSGLNKHDRSEYGKSMSEMGFEVTSLVAYWDKYSNAWAVDCLFKCVAENKTSAAICIAVFDKETGQLVEAGTRDYDDDWEPGSSWKTAEVFRHYDPQLHDIDVIAR